MTSRAALARHPVALAGIVLTTVSAAVFLALAGAAAAGLLSNPYAGLVVFVALPAMFLFGLLLIPIGMWLQRRRIKLGLAGGSEWPVIDLGIVRVRRVVLALIGLTAINIAIFLLAGYGALHWMESPTFCGQTCHTPMHPQFSAWSVSSHAQVACATCHIGEGAKSFVHAKLAGVRQLAHVATNSYPRPIPPGAQDMPQASDVCGRCHVATRDHGVVVSTVREYADDEVQYRVEDGPAHARRRSGPPDRFRPRHPLACRSGCSRRVSCPPMPAVRRSPTSRSPDRRAHEGVHRRRVTPAASADRRASRDGLHRLPQHDGPSTSRQRRRRPSTRRSPRAG